jgi:hypothetical protein
MSSMQQVVENVASAEQSHIARVAADELALLERVCQAYRALAASQAG